MLLVELKDYSANTRVKVKCDYCGKGLEKTWKDRKKQNIDLDKDACKACRFKKREEVSLKKYGVKNSSLRPDVLSKTCTVDWEKQKPEIISLYDKGWSVFAISNKLNLPKTSLTRRLNSWGLDTKGNLQSKKDKTCIEKYGKDYQIQQREKRTITNLKKYGVKNAFESNELKKKSKQTSIKKYGVEHPMKNEEIARRSSVNSLKTKIDKGLVKIYNNKTVSEIAKELGWSVSRFNVLINQYGIDTAIQMQPNESSLEQNFAQWLDFKNIIYTKQFRVSNGNKYYVADFFLNDTNILIELDGLYWHSELVLENLARTYHFNKKQFYMDNGYKPLFFREDELNNQFSIIQSIVLNKLNKSTRLYARKCTIKEVSKKASKEFLNINHLMGSGQGLSYGLYDKNQLVSLIRIKRTNKGHEISRFCHKLNTSVVGGFSRLLNHFVKLEKPKNLVTFIDQRYGFGDYLAGFGFEKISCYPSFQWTNGKDTFHRMVCKSQSGYDKGFTKIWDCGQAKYIKKF